MPTLLPKLAALKFFTATNPSVAWAEISESLGELPGLLGRQWRAVLPFSAPPMPTYQKVLLPKILPVPLAVI